VELPTDFGRVIACKTNDPLVTHPKHAAFLWLFCFSLQTYFFDTVQSSDCWRPAAFTLSVRARISMKPARAAALQTQRPATTPALDAVPSRSLNRPST
jgi:hypothetical protein